MSAQLISASYNDAIIINFTSDAWFNATAVATYFDKRPTDWLSLDSTKQYIDKLCEIIRSEKSSLLNIKRGGRGKSDSTWFHPKLAIAFARWLDVSFSIWCDMQIEKILHPLVTSPTYITEAEAQIFRKSMEHHCKHSSDKYGELYRRVYDHFGITTYKHIPAGKLGEAAKVIDIKLVGLSIPRLPAKAKKLPKPEFVKPEVESVVHVEQVRREFAAYDSFLFNFGLEVIWVLDETDPEKLVKNASRNYHGSNIGVKLDILRSQLRMWLKMVDDAEVINQAALAYAMEK